MSRLHSYSETDVTFYYVDENAKKASPKNVDTFPKLITYLKNAVQDRKHEELYLVRGILVWIAHSQSYSGREARYNTPLFYIQQLMERRMSPAEVFKIFFGYAGIECEQVTGRAKVIRYRAGDSDSENLKHHTWVAFKADGKWHVMHPQWSIQALVGYEHGGEIEIERDGRENVKVRTEKQGRPMFMVNDFWFCTAPEIFVTRCFPDDNKWQNPGNPDNVFVKTVSDFLTLPDLRQGFYDMNLCLLNEEKSCILQSKNGKCNVSVLTEKDGAKAADLSYELAMEGTSGDDLQVKDMKQLVLHQICGQERNIIQFEIRLPLVGTYWLRLAAGLVYEPGEKQNVCEFKIICKEACKNCTRFPTCAGLGAYGYRPQAEEAGLVSSSQTDAEINSEPSKGNSKQKITEFTTDNDPYTDMSYEAMMIKSGSDEVDDSVINIIMGGTDVEHNKTRGRSTVNAKVKKYGEYAVLIKAKDLKDKKAQKAKPAAAYNVTTHKEDKYEKRRDALVKQREKEVRCENHRAAKTKEKNRLEDILESTRKEIESFKVSGRRK